MGKGGGLGRGPGPEQRVRSDSGEGSLGEGSCLAVQPLHILPEACTLLLQHPQLLLGLVGRAWRTPELALGGGDSERLSPGRGGWERATRYLQVCDGGVQPV